MSTILNTLFLTKDQTYARLDHDTVKVEREGKLEMQVPLVHLGGLAVFGNVVLSPALIHSFAEEGRALSLFDRNGRFRARLVGGATGNVLLRVAQHQAVASPLALELVRAFVAGKLRNAHQVLSRGAREAKDESQAGELKRAAERTRLRLAELETAADADAARGLEGDSARAYFEVFQHLIKSPSGYFSFSGRNRRPPRDPVNALLSFLYSLLCADCVSALEGVGLDPQVGYLHGLRPGRFALALDLMEELRPFLADRLALSLINRAQLGPKDFSARSGGAVLLADQGRRTVLVAYQKRKSEEVRHQLLDKKVPIGLVPHAQARILARRLRGDIEAYIPFTWK